MKTNEKMNVSTFAAVYESATKVMNDTKKERKTWHMEEQTLTKLLHRAQTKNMMPFTKPLFGKVGLPVNGKVSKTEFLTYVTNFVDVKGEQIPAYLREVTIYERNEEGKVKTDKDGHKMPLKNEEGEVVKRLKLTPIKAGTWTLEKLLKAVCK